MTLDMNGREIKVGDVFCQPSDCDGLTAMGIVVKIKDQFVEGPWMHAGENLQSFYSSGTWEAKNIRVLASYEDTREKANALHSNCCR